MRKNFQNATSTCYGCFSTKHFKFEISKFPDLTFVRNVTGNIKNMKFNIVICGQWETENLQNIL